MMENAFSKVLKPYPIGWKAKIGILLPAHDTGYGSYEFQVLCPEGVAILETRVTGAATHPGRADRKCARMRCTVHSCWPRPGPMSSVT